MTDHLTIVGPNGWLIAVDYRPRNRRRTDVLPAGWVDPRGMPCPHADNIRPRPHLWDWEVDG